MKNSLYDRLIEYSKGSAYPFHMPGHKRQWGWMDNPYSFDITEIDGFDDLHHPQGILEESQRKAADIYKVKSSYYLVNGSTAGIMSAISALVRPGETVLAAANCHRSVWNTISLRGLNAILLSPCAVQIQNKSLINCSFGGVITAESVEKALEKNPRIKAVVITSPTYEGIVSPVKKIAETAHRFGIPLIVDEAHGAHLPFAASDEKFFPISAIREGADVVIQSLHKTLPSLTQTAILHINSSLVEEREIQRFYSIYQTSSPSYVLLASIDSCIRYMDADGREKMRQYARRLRYFWEKTKEWKNLWFLYRDKAGVWPIDPSKIVFGSYSNGCGLWLMRLLREKFHLECEMCQEEYVIAMTSLMDSEEGFLRLENALAYLNQEAEKWDECQKENSEWITTEDEISFLTKEEGNSIWLTLENAEGKYAANHIAVYPPGIPFLHRGQCITKEKADQIIRYYKSGFRLDGIRRKEYNGECMIEVEVFDKKGNKY